ncbi:3'(2'),5'-bisphosphate nucleotidase CysQ [Teredinibacter turnerae]|uniref:3'(2'),5'-bisphosphate nucleotidase CysQ n=1 Tax=Teredinibacter turnerae TaxID=2426 RepID=UPI00037F986B|nr:3'(2'),5'-bisphosphate nucleotidase CysQ [Teredinibacter turnerae]
MNDSALLEPVIAASEQAGAAIAAIFRDFKQQQVQRKKDDSPVTEADLAAHHMLVQALSGLTPDIPVLSEESVLPSFAQRQTWQRYWLVDPLDGTQEFIDGGSEFTVNVALIDNNRPVLGVVHAPMLDLTYGAVVGVGAWKRHHGNNRAIRTRSLAARLARGDALELVCSRRHGVEAIEKLAAELEQKLGLVVTKSVGSSLKFCLVAEGEADIYPRLAPCCEWDTAASQAIVEAAGGCIVDMQFQPLAYNRTEDLLNDHFFAFGDPAFEWQSYFP